MRSHEKRVAVGGLDQSISFDPELLTQLEFLHVIIVFAEAGSVFQKLLLLEASDVGFVHKVVKSASLDGLIVSASSILGSDVGCQQNT